MPEIFTLGTGIFPGLKEAQTFNFSATPAQLRASGHRGSVRQGGGAVYFIQRPGV